VFENRDYSPPLSNAEQRRCSRKDIPPMLTKSEWPRQRPSALRSRSQIHQSASDSPRRSQNKKRPLPRDDDAPSQSRFSGFLTPCLQPGTTTCAPAFKVVVWNVHSPRPRTIRNFSMRQRERPSSGVRQRHRRSGAHSPTAPLISPRAIASEHLDPFEPLSCVEIRGALQNRAHETSVDVHWC